MTKSHSIDYAGVLSELRTRLRIIDKERAELIKAIESMGALAAIGSPESSGFQISSITIGESSAAKLSVYDATIALLENKGSFMNTDEIIKILREKDVVPKDRPKENIATVMYKAARNRNNSELNVKRGKWTLKSWN